MLNRVKTRELENELTRLEDVMWEDIKQETDLLCELFSVEQRGSIEQVCFLEDTDQMLWTNIILTEAHGDKLRDGKLFIDDVGGSRSHASVQGQRIPEGRESVAVCYHGTQVRHDGTTENGYRAVYLLRYQENVIWAWTIPVSDENLEIISHRCQRLNELSDQFESDARSIPRDTSELTADVKMLADIVGALIEAYQSDVRNIVQEPAMREDDLNQLRRLVGNITGSVIDYE
tara:strand:+ start:1891 stop:2586 length:696 start_codon:yes stop_codon:yes gene_type:complete